MKTCNGLQSHVYKWGAAFWHFNSISSAFPEQFQNSAWCKDSVKVGCCKAEKQSQWFRTRGRVETAFLWIHDGYWLISLRLRSELAQLVMRLQSWMLVSTEAELCNWLVAQRSLVRTASSASWSMFWMAVLGGLTGGRAGARTGVEDGVKGEGAAGGGKVARPPAAAPSQCSGLGTDTLAWLPLVLGPPLSSGGAAWAGGWAASCRSLTCDKAAWAFSAEGGQKKKVNNYQVVGVKKHVWKKTHTIISNNYMITVS